MQLSGRVQQFVVRYINSIDQLEMLLLLAHNPEKDWTAEQIARALFTERESAATRLDELANHAACL
jgi:hypothetical protein